FLKDSGQYGSQGSGNRSPSRIARLDASGRRAHHRCSVLGWPWRIIFSRAAYAETAAIGKSTSASRLHSFGIIGCASPSASSRTAPPTLDIADRLVHGQRARGIAHSQVEGGALPLCQVHGMVARLDRHLADVVPIELVKGQREKRRDGLTKVSC